MNRGQWDTLYNNINQIWYFLTMRWDNTLVSCSWDDSFSKSNSKLEFLPFSSLPFRFFRRKDRRCPCSDSCQPWPISICQLWPISICPLAKLSTFAFTGMHPNLNFDSASTDPYDGSNEFCSLINRDENEFYSDLIFLLLFKRVLSLFLLNVISLCYSRGQPWRGDMNPPELLESSGFISLEMWPLLSVSLVLFRSTFLCRISISSMRSLFFCLRTSFWDRREALRVFSA